MKLLFWCSFAVVAYAYFGYALLLANTLGLSPRFTPAVAAYWERLRVRPAFVRAKAVQGAELVLDSPAA